MSPKQPKKARGRGGGGGGLVPVAQLGRVDVRAYEALSDIACSDVQVNKGVRIGSMSVHAQVYSVRDYPNIVMKLVPFTVNSYNESTMLMELSLRTLKERLHHFPISYGTYECVQSQAKISDPALVRAAFDDLDPINVAACNEYMRRNLRGAATVPAILRKELAAPTADQTTRRWRVFKTLGIAEDHDYSAVKTLTMYAERADCDLGVLLEKKERSPAELASILYQVTVALSYIARPDVGGYAHGDLHAGNVLVRELAEPRKLVYPASQGHCATLGAVRDYAMLWDFETMAPASPADHRTVLEDFKRLATSLNGNVRIRERQPQETRRLLELLDRREWTSLSQIAAYLTRPSLRVKCAPRAAEAPISEALSSRSSRSSRSSPTSSPASQ